MNPTQLTRVTAYRRAPHSLSKQEAVARVQAEDADQERQIVQTLAAGETIGAVPTIAVMPWELAVCRGGCPEYEHYGMQERCWEGLTRGTCYRPAMEQWLGRALGNKAACEGWVEARASLSETPVKIFS